MLWLIALLVPVCPAGAAPVPLPKPVPSTEAVFDAQTPERCRAVAAFLRSRHFLDWIRYGGNAARALPDFQTSGQLIRWQRANLTVTGEGALLCACAPRGRPGDARGDQ